MTLTAMTKVFIGRIGRGEMRLGEVPAYWRPKVENALLCKGQPRKPELLEVAELLDVPVPGGATNPEIAAIIQAFAA